MERSSIHEGGVPRHDKGPCESVDSLSISFVSIEYIESIISLSYSYLNGNPNLQADRKRNSFYHLLKKVQKIFCPIMEGSDVQE